MSYWVYLKDSDGETVEVKRHTEGGAYCVGGITQAELNVTYNYGRFYYDFIPDGLRGLDGMTAQDAIPLLEAAEAKLGTWRDDDYWKSTPGNAGYALSILLGWARQYPDAVFSVH